MGKVTTSFMSIIGDISTVRDDDNYFKISAMMTGSLPSSSSSSTSSSNGSKPVNDDQFVDDLVSRLLQEDSGDDLVNGLNSLLKQSLTETGEKTYQDSSPWQSKHWLSPTQSNGHRDMMEPLKILTNEFAENLGLGSNHKGVDSGYISPSNGILPTTPVKPFFRTPASSNASNDINSS